MKGTGTGVLKMKTLIPISVVIILRIQYAESCGGQSFGLNNFQGDLTQEDTLSGFATIGSSQVYKINCCGVLRRWKFFPQSAGTVDFQVWRPMENNQYRVLARNRVDIKEENVKKVQTLSLPKSIRISVEPNDIIGWYQPGKAIISYGSGVPNGHLQKEFASDPLKTGGISDWTNAIQRNGRTYAVQALGANNSPPRFKNLAGLTINMSDNYPVGSALKGFLIEVDDDDRNDIPGMIIALSTSNNYFDVKSETRQVIVKAKPPVGTHSLFLRVRDHCDASAGGTLRIRVFHEEPVQPTVKYDMALGMENRYSTEGDDGHHLWVIGVVFAIAILLTIVLSVWFLARIGRLPLLTSKTKPVVNDATPRKTSQQTDNKERKTSKTKENKETKSPRA